ncbi:MAG: hypothetical protein HYW23_03900 [Candidatus Aenigmarchaeota archaeon]|nr:hypothetical protein [Candidatus Aenigmarchaeota archaeon]
MKASAVTEAITLVGVVTVSVMMFSQVPGIITDMKIVLSKESSLSKVKEISSLISIASSSPSDMKIVYDLKEKSSVSSKDGILTLTTSKGTISYKTLSDLKDFTKVDVDKLTIIKTIQDGKVTVEVI